MDLIILEEAYNDGHLSAKSLLAYCKEEIEKRKYRRAFRNMFEELFMQLTKDIDPEAYLTMQEKLFNSLSDKASYEAKTILDRKIDFYKNQGDEVTPWKIVEENIQMKQEKIKGAVNSLFRNKYPVCWDEYLVIIDQKENGTKRIREISQRLTEDEIRIIENKC